MAVNSVTASGTQYSYASAPKSVKEFPDRYIYTYEEPASTGKKVGVGLASGFLPGLGQAINGQWGKAAGFAGGYFGGSLLLGSVGLLSLFKHSNKVPSIAGGVSMVLGSIALLGVNIWSIVDAVKNSSSKREITVMKEN